MYIHATFLTFLGYITLSGVYSAQTEFVISEYHESSANNARGRRVLKRQGLNLLKARLTSASKGMPHSSNSAVSGCTLTLTRCHDVMPIRMQLRRFRHEELPCWVTQFAVWLACLLTLCHPLFIGNELCNVRTLRSTYQRSQKWPRLINICFILHAIWTC